MTVNLPGLMSSSISVSPRFYLGFGLGRDRDVGEEIRICSSVYLSIYPSVYLSISWDMKNVFLTNH